MIKSVIGEVGEFDFLPPRNRKVHSLEAWDLGARTIGYVKEDSDKHNWHCYVKDQKEVWVEREDLWETIDEVTKLPKLVEIKYKIIDFTDPYIISVVGENPVITELDFSLDQNMREFIILKINHKWYRYNWVNNQYELKPLQNKFKHCKISMDTNTIRDMSRSDIILVYITLDGKLCYSTQRTGFLEEGIIVGEGMENKYIQKVGLTTDDNFGILIR